MARLLTRRDVNAGKAPTSFGEAVAFLDGRDDVAIMGNTRLIRLDEHTVAVRFHNTYIVTFHRDGSIDLNSGGWQTVTTKARINSFLPPGIGVFQKAYVWYVSRVDDEPVEFDDGMTLGSGWLTEGRRMWADKVASWRNDF